MRNAYKILKLENLEKRDYVEDLGIDGWLILKSM
jgi:hypothetical protein